METKPQKNGRWPPHFPSRRTVVLVGQGGGRKQRARCSRLRRKLTAGAVRTWKSLARGSRFIATRLLACTWRVVRFLHLNPTARRKTMPIKTWTLIDVEKDIYLDSLSLGSAELGGAAAGLKVRKRRLHGGRREGVDVVEIDNGKFSVSVLPTRGMGLWKAKLGDLELGWHSPALGPVHPQFVNLWESSGLGWLGGFDELLCRCGLESNGGPVHNEKGELVYPLHGKIANSPAHKVTLSIDSDSGELTLTGVVDEARLYHPKLRLTSTIRTKPGEPGIRITDEVHNVSAEPGEFELLYHVNFGPPLLDAGASVVAPVKAVMPMTPRAAEGIKTWNVYGPEEPGYTEQVYLFELAADNAGRHANLVA